MKGEGRAPLRRIVTRLVAATGALRARSREREGPRRVVHADLHPLHVNSMRWNGGAVALRRRGGAPPLPPA